MENDVADLRAEIARQRKPRYEVAALVGLHPNYFGKMLNEKLPMPLDVWERACEALGLAGDRNRGVTVG